MMSEDIHKWTDGRYKLMFDEHTFFVFDNEREKEMTALEVTKKLNEQQTIISQLKEKNEQLEKENTFLAKQRDYWKSKFDEGTETFESNLVEENNRLKFENECLKMENEEQKELIPKKLVVTITPTFYGYKSKVEEMGK